jgi:hypothetical protein
MDGEDMDYSEPYLKVERKLKDIYRACIEKRSVDAMELCLEAIVDLRLLYATLHDKVEKEDPNPVGIWNLKDLA